MCFESWSLIKGFRIIEDAEGILTFKATNHYFKNKSYTCTGDFTIAVDKAKNGGDYYLVVTKDTSDNVIITLPDNSKVSGSEDLIITLSGVILSKFWIHFTFDGVDFIWTLLGVSSGDSGSVSETEILESAADYADAGNAATLEAAQAYYDSMSLNIPEVVALSYTFVLSDKDKIKVMNSETAQQFIIPVNASVPFPIGTRIHISTKGTSGITTFSAEGGVTINSADNFLRLRTRFACATIIKTGLDEWLLTGDLSL